MWFHKEVQNGTGMDKTNRKVLLLIFILLLSQLTCEAHSMFKCCKQPSPSCQLYMLLCNSDTNALRGTLPGDASAGILTLGKRKDDVDRLQTRLQQLLHVSRNPAAGILTMGKRKEESAQYSDWMSQAGVSFTTPALK